MIVTNEKSNTLTKLNILLCSLHYKCLQIASTQINTNFGLM